MRKSRGKEIIKSEMKGEKSEMKKEGACGNIRVEKYLNTIVRVIEDGEDI